MASDEITSVGHVTLETYTVDEHIVPKPPPAITPKHDVPHEETPEDTGLAQLTLADALDQEDLPWITLAKWRKSLVLAGYVAGLNTSYLYLIVSIVSS
jgi:hypothetical protein